MISSLYKLARPMIFKMDPEVAHNASIHALQTGLPSICSKPKPSQRLRTELAGLIFENPVGLAAGYDKNAEVPGQCLQLGFGFVEIGSVTPRPQEGNLRPRLFRLVNSQGIINRMGFNNEGHESVHNNLRSASRPASSILGINIGANKDSPDMIEDYIVGLRKFWKLADYFTVNISSPNTPGLRNLQAKDSLKALLEKLMEAREAMLALDCINRPIFLKIAPDIDETLMDDIAQVVGTSSLDGLIVSNTTLNRSTVQQEIHAQEAGGLSGKPLFERSTIVLAKMRQRLGPKAKIIGVGGVDSAWTAFEKISAGANLVQLYSALIYHGPSLPAAIVNGLDKMCVEHGISKISDQVGKKTAQWAAKPLE